MLNWQLNADFTFDPVLITEVEVRFIADGENATRVDLEHRDLERLGNRAEAFRQPIASPGGWAGLLQLFASSEPNAGAAIMSNIAVYARQSLCAQRL